MPLTAMERDFYQTGCLVFHSTYASLASTSHESSGVSMSVSSTKYSPMA